MQMQDAQNSD